MSWIRTEFDSGTVEGMEEIDFNALLSLSSSQVISLLEDDFEEPQLVKESK